MFIDTERRTDNDLPFDRKELQATEWLGPRDGDEFFQKQWIFCPFVIIERQKPYDETELQMERRMPFIQKRQPIGEGASAEVYMEVVAPYYLEYNPTPTRKAINKTVSVLIRIKFHSYGVANDVERPRLLLAKLFSTRMWIR